MKRSTAIGGLALVLLFGAAFVLRGQPRPEPVPDAKKEPRKISTSGSATIRVKPDSAHVFFGVQTMAPTIKAAREESTQKVKKVLDALNALKIPDLKMKTSDVSVEVVQRQGDGVNLPEILGYRISNSFTALIKGSDPQKLGQGAGRILDTALENGANYVQQIVIFREDTKDAKRQALTRAVEDAAGNARALAAGANAKIVETITIDGQPEYYGGSRLTNAQAAQPSIGGDDETTVLAGEVEVTCRVSVTFTY